MFTRLVLQYKFQINISCHAQFNFSNENLLVQRYYLFSTICTSYLIQEDAYFICCKNTVKIVLEILYIEILYIGSNCSTIIKTVFNLRRMFCVLNCLANLGGKSRINQINSLLFNCRKWSFETSNFCDLDIKTLKIIGPSHKCVFPVKFLRI